MIECINAAAEEVSSLEPDFILFQEVDFDSTRSYHIDEQEIMRAAFRRWRRWMPSITIQRSSCIR